MKPELFVKNQRPLQTEPNEPEDDAATEKAKSRRLRLVLMSALVMGGAGAALYTVTHIAAPPPPHAAPADMAQAVSVIEIGTHDFHPTITLNGEARPKQDIHVFAPASGVRVMALLVDEGAKVHAGQPLARLDTTLANAQIQAAQANVAEAASNALKAKDEWQRAESIRSSGALSDEAIDQRHAASVAADARLAAARAQQQEVNARMQGGYVRAPVSGTVISRSVQLGAMVDQQEMFRIAGGDALEVSSQIGEQDVLSLQLGQNASFRLVDGTTETGTLTRSPASINSRTRTGEALFDLPSNTRVKAGMFLRGEASLSSRNAMSAPQSSVLYDNGQPYVFVVDASRHAHKTILRLGLREGDSVEVLSGLQPGARIVGAGAAFIQDGDIVRPIEAPHAAAAPQIRGDIEDLPQLRGRSDG